MTAPNRKLSGLISSITKILDRVQEALSDQFYRVEVHDTRQGCINLRVVTTEGRVFGFRLALCAESTTRLLRRFVKTSLTQLHTQERLVRTDASPLLQEEIRVFIQIARSSRNDFDRLIARISAAIKDVVSRWGNFGPGQVAGVHVRGGNGGSAYAPIENLFKMARVNPLSISTHH